METFIYKYPKRQISLYTERNYNYDNQDNLSETQTITSFNNSGLLSKINISPKKNNFIPKPNLRHEFIKRNKGDLHNSVPQLKVSLILYKSSQRQEKNPANRQGFKLLNLLFNKLFVLARLRIILTTLDFFGMCPRILFCCVEISLRTF